MYIIVKVENTKNIIGLKEDIAMRLEKVERNIDRG